MWRKTRSKQESLALSTCYGVDPNRNFDFYWNHEGSSSDCNADDYAGPSAFSEPETKNMANWILRLAKLNNLEAMFTLHSYSQVWLVPYGYISPPVYPLDYDELVC